MSVAHADRIALATDNSIYQIAPQAAVFPQSVDDVVRIVRLAARPEYRGIRLAPRGGGTGTNGQSLTDGIAVDLSRHMNRIISIDLAGRTARVQAGVVKDQIDQALAPAGLFFSPELSTSSRATIGGMINTDASGQGSCLYGKTHDHVLELTTVLLDGTVWCSGPIEQEQLAALVARTDRVGAVHRAVDIAQREHGALFERLPRLPRGITGYDLAHVRDERGRFNLNSVLCGSEGTLGFVVEAKLSLDRVPRYSALVILRYAEFDTALRDAARLTAHRPASIETIDATVLSLARRDPTWEGVREFFSGDSRDLVGGLNIVEFVAEDAAELEEATNRVAASLQDRPGGRRGVAIARGRDAVRRVWAMRKRAVGLLGNSVGEHRPIPFIEDTAVPPEQLADYIAELRSTLDARGLRYGMFGHVDAGVLHVRPALDMRDPAQRGLVRTISDEVVRLTGKYHGVLWGEHGKGVRSEYAPAFFGAIYPGLQAIKAAFDPLNQLNAGKVVAPTGAGLLHVDGVPTRGEPDARVPLGAAQQFAGAIHCNGNAACHSFDADDVMCPSWKATRDRAHSPKGRAALLREWLRLLHEAEQDPWEAPTRRARTWLSLPAKILWTTLRAFGVPDFSCEVMAAMSDCLSCRACATQCPIRVDVTAMRSLFLEAYHQRYLRPPRHYAVGYFEHFLPWLAKAPRIFNAVMESRVGRLAAGAFGLVKLPSLSRISVDDELRKRGVEYADPARLHRLPAAKREQSVILVQDAFTRFFDTQVLLDAIDLFVAIGATPWLAPLLVNGKGLHVHGFREAFARVAGRNARVLGELASSGIPLIGIEPATTLTYRTEYVEALGEAGAPRVLLLQEWLGSLPAASPAPPITHAYRLFAHCTERTSMAAARWKQVFERFGLGLSLELVGCCGMAGTFGHERAHRGLSSTIYRQSWGVHLMRDDAPPLASGYSCRAQARAHGISLQHPVEALLSHHRGAGRSVPAADVTGLGHRGTGAGPSP